MDNTETITQTPPTAAAPAPEPKAPAAKGPAAAPRRTRAELVQEGWSAAELKMAEDAGEIPAEGKKEPAAQPPALKKDGAAPAPEKEPVADPEDKPEAKAPAKPAGGIPDMTLSPEKEAEFVKLFPPGTPQHGLYFYGKKERRERQRLAVENETLRRALAAQTAPPAAPAPGEEGAEDLDKPLTARMLRELQKKDEEQRQQAHEQQRARHKVVTAAQKEQEDYARTVYPDFEPTVALAREVINTFETLFPEKWQQDEVVELIDQLQRAALQADHYGLEDNNAARIVHKIGRMHPKYGKASAPADDEPLPKTDKTGPQDPKAPSGHTLATLKRIEKNTQRRPSSAAVPSGDGGRALVPGEVTAEHLDAMTSKEREAFRDANPALYAELMRG